MGRSVEEQAAVLSLTRATTADWYRTATVIYENRGALDLLRGRIGFVAEKHRRYAAELAARVDPNHASRCVKLIELMAGMGNAASYGSGRGLPSEFADDLQPSPVHLGSRLASAEDFKSVAVVGTGDASEEGRKRDYRLTRELVGSDVTVLSGLARGIDTAAHTGALAVEGETAAVAVLQM